MTTSTLRDSSVSGRTSRRSSPDHFDGAAGFVGKRRAMNRRDTLLELLAFAAAPVAGVVGAIAGTSGALAQQAKIPTIGLLWTDIVRPSPLVATLSEALRVKGYVVGRNIQVEDRVVLEGYGGMAENAAQLVRAGVDVIFAFGTTASVAAAKATKKIPIVMILGADPVALGLVESLSHPGTNITGVTTVSFELTAKRFQLLRELVPKMSRMGVLLAVGSSASPSNRQELETAAKAVHLQLHVADVRGPEEFNAAFSDLEKARVDGLYVPASSMMSANRSQLIGLAAKHRLPALYADRRYVDSGGLMFYGPNIYDSFAMAASHVDRVLKGTQPSDLPIEQTNRIELVINLKTANALSLKIPQSVRIRADEIIE
jgi:putative tryptophan/tyrosine transport system substrate-binding protein